MKNIGKALLLVSGLLLVASTVSLAGGFTPSGGAGATTAPAAYVYAFLPAATNTTIVVAETYYPLAGPFTNAPRVGFTIDVDRLVYSGPSSRYFEIDYHASISLDVSNENVHLGVKINTSTPTGVMGTTCKTAGEAYALSGTCIVYLSEGDTIQLVATSSASGSILDTRHFTTTIRPL